MTGTEFAAFFRAVHGYEPFPWQTRLAAGVVATGRWPDLLDLPTASGKTCVLDVALFALALRPEVSPRRIVLVVDRRVVVDQAKDHADRIRAALQDPQDPVLRTVRERIRCLWDGPPEAPPFLTQVLRGGMVREDDWAKRPDQPVVALSTVDQVGSRLLFSGYGVSDRMAPVHAGLLGNDTLFLLDEVHLSVPFAETLRAVRERWRRLPDGLPDRFGVVRMSATPGSSAAGESCFELADEDRTDPTLSRRLAARKVARLEPVTVGGDEPERKRRLAARAVREALALVENGASAVGIVVNRVDTARAARHELEGRNLEACLLTGRMRPWERDRIVAAVLDRLRAGRRREPGQRPLVVVATQCIEAGADLDFDALVTECASLDALRQRFGRLDRCGDLGESRAVILARKDQIGEKTEDPIYGAGLAATWEWLTSHGEDVDFGISSLALPPSEELASLITPATHAPILLPAHLDAWSQTGPRPWPLPDVSLWLHGPERAAPEVQVIWRADIEPGALEGGLPSLSACPPSSLEAVSLPIFAARRWLLEVEAEVADAPMPEPVDRSERRGGNERHVLRWAGEESKEISPAEIRPGDTLIVPSAYGGLRHGNFDPDAQEPVVDLGDRVQWAARRKATLRLHPLVLADWGLAPGRASAAPRVQSADDSDSDPGAEVRAWLEGTPMELPDPWPEVRRELLRRVPAPRLIALPNGTWVLVARRVPGEVSTEDDGASFVEREVGLDRHGRDVAAFASNFAASVGLAPKLQKDLALAARLHDVGKADPRFQKMLVGGSEVRFAMLKEPLAKSAVPLRDLGARLQARARAGYPRGYRHEVLSVALADSAPELLARASDPDLVLHLVGSHHGWGRPFAPAHDDPDEREVALDFDGHHLVASTRHGLARLDSGVSDRYWRLVESYGWWGLAWLEAILRLADHRASESEQKGEEISS